LTILLIPNIDIYFKINVYFVPFKVK
jgi:hypothetical protein